MVSRLLVKRGIHSPSKTMAAQGCASRNSTVDRRLHSFGVVLVIGADATLDFANSRQSGRAAIRLSLQLPVEASPEESLNWISS